MEESIVETDLGSTATANRVADAFSLGPPVAPMVLAARGEQGVIWRLDTEEGSFAVKELSIRQGELDVAKEVAFQEGAAAHASSYSVARTLRTPAGGVLAEVSGRQIRVQTWLEMAAADPWLDPTGVGVMLAELHAAGEPRSDPVDGWYTSPVGEQRWQELLRRLTARTAPVTALMESALPRLVALERLLEPARLPRTCHRDLWADNVRTTPAGGLCVFDWDNCGPADPGHELAMLAFEFGMGSSERIRPLYDAYVQHGGPGRIVGRGDLTMVIAQFGHFYEMAIQPYLDDDPVEDDLRWARGRLDELEGRPLTLDEVDLIVDTCSNRSG
jgi:fructosamine-3-kinase